MVFNIVRCCCMIHRDVKRGKGFELLVLTVAILATIFGFFSHFFSAWTSVEDGEGDRAYKFVCDYVRANSLEEKCPSIAMDYTFLTSISLGFVAACVAYGPDYDGNFSRKWRLVEMILHRLTSLLLVIGAALYIVAARQINVLSEKVEMGDWPREDPPFLGMDSKYIAVAAAILQAILHIFFPRRPRPVAKDTEDPVGSTGNGNPA